MPKQILSFTALATLLLAGCQTWNPGGANYTDKKGAFSLHTPSEWMYATTLGRDFIASKDGPILQQITIEHRELKEALANTKRPLTASLAPYEVAEAVLDDMHADHTLLGFELKENAPATIGGRPGFKLTYVFHTEEKLRLEETLYGCIVGDKLWLLRYRAPLRHYFERDLATFEATVQSFQFQKT